MVSRTRTVTLTPAERSASARSHRDRAGRIEATSVDPIALTQPAENPLALADHAAVGVAGALTPRERLAAYVYVIVVDGVIRYIGKGRNDRLYNHVIEARRTARRCGAHTAHLRPRFHRKLVEAIRAGSHITERIIRHGMSDKDAYRFEHQLIVEYHRQRTDQLWNTIDERFMDRRLLPEEWRDPECWLYKVPRPLTLSQEAEGGNRRLALPFVRFSPLSRLKARRSGSAATRKARAGETVSPRPRRAR